MFQCKHEKIKVLEKIKNSERYKVECAKCKRLFRLCEDINNALLEWNFGDDIIEGAILNVSKLKRR